jgi:peptidyl-prolyl cis-trans isomerase D
MLRYLRSQKLMRTVMRLTLILVIPSFILFYGWSTIKSGGGRGGGGFYYARVKKATIGRWSEIQDYELRAARERLTRDFMNYAMLIGLPPALFQQEGMERYIRMKDMVYEAIKERILLDYARKHGLTVTDNELKMQIKAAWPKDTALYLRAYLRQNRMSEAEFISKQKHDLLLRKAEEQIMSQAKVSLFELWQEYLLSEEQIKIDYVKFPVEAYLDRVSVNEDEVEKFFTEHIEDYRIPDQVRYQYLLISREDLKSSVTVSQDEIRRYYESHKSEFKEPQSVLASHVFIPIENPDDEESVSKAERRILEIEKEAKKPGADFAAIADRDSQDPANEFVNADGKKEKKGGSLGWITPSYQLWGDAFTSDVLKMQAGEISKPLRAKQGFHIVKAEKVKKERTLSFSEAKDSVLAILHSEKVDALFKSEGERLKTVYEKYTTLQAVAHAMGLSIRTTGLVDAGNFYFPGIGDLTQNRDLISELDVGIMSEVISTPMSYVVMQLEKKIPSHLPALEEVKDRVVMDWKNAQAREHALADARAFLGGAKNVDEMKKLATEKDYTLKTTDYFTRMNMPPELGDVYLFASSTLNTPVGEISLTSLGPDQKHVRGYIVWDMLEKKSPSKEKFKEDLPRLERELLFPKRRAVLQEYLRDQIASLKIDIPAAFRE